MKAGSARLPPLDGADVPGTVPGESAAIPAAPNSGKPARSRRKSPAPLECVEDDAGGAESRYLIRDNSGAADDEEKSPMSPMSPSMVLDRSGVENLTLEGIHELVEEYPWLLDKEIKSLAKLFNEWDEDGSGEISVDEMGEMFDRLTRSLFKKMDQDMDNHLNRIEVTALGLALGQKLNPKQLDEAMAAMDDDGDGVVNWAEFEAWWKTGKGYATREELEDLFAEVDADGSGEIDLMEFLHMIGKKTEGKRGETKLGVDGKRDSLPLGTDTKEGDPMQLVRIALEGVRDDVRAIYGASTRPKSSWQMARELEDAINARRCFVTTDSGTSSDVFRKGWDLVQAMLLIYVAIAVPYRIGFGVDVPVASPMFWFEVFVDLYFVLDIIINFRTGFRDSEGEMVVDSKAVAMAYLKNWFVLDVVACLPITYVELIFKAAGVGEGGGGGGAQLKALKILRLLRLAKMLRLAKIKAVIKRLDEDFPGIFTVSKLSSLVLIILYIAHLFASFWYFVGSFDMALQDGSKISGWVATFFSEKPGYSMASAYIDSYYYAITTLTTVGYGDVTPNTDAEKIFSIFTELAGGIVFGLLAGTLSAMLSAGNAAQERIEEELDQLKEFMMIKKIDKELRRQIMDNMASILKEDKGSEEEILERLPPKHRKTLLNCMYRPLLMSCPLFAGLEESIITKVSMNMAPYIGVKGDVIVQENDVGDHMYMVLHGEVTLRSVNCPKFNGRCWVDGAFFGELPLLGLGFGDVRNRHVYDVEAHVDCELIYITRSQLRDLESDYPIFKSQVRQLAAKRAERFGLTLGRVTLQVDHVQRRMSVALDMESLGAVDPALAKAFGIKAKPTAAKPAAQKEALPTKAVQLGGTSPRPTQEQAANMTNAQAMAMAVALHAQDNPSEEDEDGSGEEEEAVKVVAVAEMSEEWGARFDKLEARLERLPALEEKLNCIPKLEEDLRQVMAMLKALTG